MHTLNWYGHIFVDGEKSCGGENPNQPWSLDNFFITGYLVSQQKVHNIIELDRPPLRVILNNNHH